MSESKCEAESSRQIIDGSNSQQDQDPTATARKFLFHPLRSFRAHAALGPGLEGGGRERKRSITTAFCERRGNSGMVGGLKPVCCGLV